MKSTIHYGLILDKSGSMDTLKETVISAFNEQRSAIAHMQRQNRDCEIKVSLCTFNSHIDMHYLAATPGAMKKLTPKNYRPDLFTALFDAIGFTVSQMKTVINPGDRPYLVVFTDGLENASKEYSSDQIRQLLDQLKHEGWTIQFFCSTENRMFHKQSLGLDDTVMFCLALNEEGISDMNENIKSSLKKMVEK